MRVGVIGSNWGRMQIGAFRGAGAEVVALCGRDPAKTARIASEERIALPTTELAALIEASEVVVVASPDREHQRHVVAALDAGRHVLCEKPLAFSREEAFSLCAHPSQGVRAVGFPYRMLPPMIALRRFLADRAPVSIEVSVHNSFAAGPGREASGDLGGLSHLIDAVLWLLDDVPLTVEASLWGEPSHSASFTLTLGRGAVATVTQRAAAEPGILSRWSVFGEGWQTKLEGGYRPEWGGWEFGPAFAFERHWSELSPRVIPARGRLEPWAQAHVETARAFLDRIAGVEGSAPATFEQAATVQSVIASVAESHLLGQRIDVEQLP